MTFVMSISLNVVKIAALCCACTKRSAIFLRIFVIGMRLISPCFDGPCKTGITTGFVGVAGAFAATSIAG